MKYFEIIDTFCGAGGTTEGFEQAKFMGEKIADVISCINHCKLAIESHSANHIRAKHFLEDIRNFDVTRFPKFSKDAIKVLHASLECTNFSNAKGGKPRDADSRTLANHLIPYVEYLDPDYITIENVREFLAWGDLDDNGKPINREKGRSFVRWINRIKKYGYNVEWKILNSADYGAYTSRKRLFIIFAKYGFPIAFPEPTHNKKGNYGLLKWNAVKDVLDFDDEGNTIFERKKPLSDKTFERIYAGLLKFIPNSDNFIVKYLGNNSKTGINNGKSINDPLNTITTQNRLAMIKVVRPFLSKYFTAANPESMNIDVDEPAHSITTKDHHSIIQADMIGKQAFIDSYISNKPKDVQESMFTITTQPQHSLVQPEFLLKYYSTGDNVSSVEDPSPTLTTKDRIAVIKPVFWMDHQFSSGQRNKSVDYPAGSLTTIPKQTLIKVEQAFLMNRQFNNVGSSIDQPSPTLIATMGKRPQYLIITEKGEFAIKIYKDDTEIVKKIKIFMAEHGIIDIKMRMLRVDELLKIQGFPDNYILKGNQAEQKKFIGNSVVPLVAKKLLEALYGELLKINKTA